ncbi:hypothetical protein J2Y58_002374 [Sphingomonas sp. BE138]|nr:hypothetical protein [Sphingomonas sp. BE138]
MAIGDGTAIAASCPAGFQIHVAQFTRRVDQSVRTAA